jgi:N-acetylglutamate synthase-like GNAT family acetyltransferase
MIPLTLIAHNNGTPIGTASLVAHDMKTRLDRTPWLASVYVLPSYRRRGFGAALCRRAVREARRLGYERIYLFTPDKAEFYRARGWKEIERAKYRNQKVTIMTFG